MNAPRKRTCDELGLCQGSLNRPDCACPHGQAHAWRPVQTAPAGVRTDTPETAVAITRHKRSAAYRRLLAWLRQAARAGR